MRLGDLRSDMQAEAEALLAGLNSPSNKWVKEHWDDFGGYWISTVDDRDLDRVRPLLGNELDGLIGGAMCNGVRQQV